MGLLLSGWANTDLYSFFIDKNNLQTDQSKKCPCRLTRVLFQSLLGFRRITIHMQKNCISKEPYRSL